MVEGILLAIVSLAIGGLISHMYSSKSSKELKAHSQKLESQLSGINSDLAAISSKLENDEPEIAKEIKEVITKHTLGEALPTIFNNGDPCPSCGVGTVEHLRWGNGPLGPCNAWFGCKNCGYEFQTLESASD